MKRIHTIILAVCLLGLTGCAATQIEKLRKKIPAGHADELSATVTTIGGWGGKITAKNLDSDGKGRLSADEYTETVSTPWVTTNIDLTGSSIGKKKLEVKPASETEAAK